MIGPQNCMPGDVTKVNAPTMKATLIRLVETLEQIAIVNAGTELCIRGPGPEAIDSGAKDLPLPNRQEECLRALIDTAIHLASNVEHGARRINEQVS